MERYRKIQMIYFPTLLRAMKRQFRTPLHNRENIQCSDVIQDYRNRNGLSNPHTRAEK